MFSRAFPASAKLFFIPEKSPLRALPKAPKPWASACAPLTAAAHELIKLEITSTIAAKPKATPAPATTPKPINAVLKTSITGAQLSKAAFNGSSKPPKAPCKSLKALLSGSNSPVKTLETKSRKPMKLFCHAMTAPAINAVTTAIAAATGPEIPVNAAASLGPIDATFVTIPLKPVVML